MPQKYKLIYFNVKGRAECARLIFAQAGVDYEDYRTKEGEWPGELKAKTPMGQLPVLEVDGKMMSQSMAIARYLAREFKLVGKDNWESAKCDMLADGLGDLFGKFTPWFMEKDEEKKKTLLEGIMKDHVCPFLEIVTKAYEKNGTGFIIGNQMTWGDLLLFSVIDWWKNMGDLASKFPKLIEHNNMVASQPNIKKWLAARPVTPM